MNTELPVSVIPNDKQEKYVRLHLKKAASSLGYKSGSQQEYEFIEREVHNVLKEGHPMTVNVTDEQLREIRG